jgi:hypothetical protein
MFLENPHKVLRQLDNGQEYVIYSAKAVEVTVMNIGKYEAGYEVIAKGQSSDINEELCKILLPAPKFINNILTSSMCNSYKCFCSDNLKLEQYIAHHSAKSSWDCLINSIGNPTHVIIIQRPVSDVKTDTT